MPAIVWVQPTQWSQQQRRSCARKGFTLLDVLVSLAVITVLIGLMLPALTAIRETSRKVVCSSNIRQVGLATAMYAEDYKRKLPYSANFSKFVSNNGFTPQSLMQARLGMPDDSTSKWDGLGLLFGSGYCNAAQVYYCPSHRSIHRYETYASGWAGAPVAVYTNFQYRGGTVVGSTSESNLDKMTNRISLVGDGMASEMDFNHIDGGNVVVSDLSIAWFDDLNKSLLLPSSYNDPAAHDKLRDAWNLIDYWVGK
ncbi:MAG: type II secretion system protein [Phycisphaerales bacterium]